MSTIIIAGGRIDLDADLPRILDAIEAQRSPVIALMRAGSDTSRTVTGLDWTVSDLHAHLAATADNYERMAAGEVVMTENVSQRRAVIDRGIAGQSGARAGGNDEVVADRITRLAATLRSQTDETRLPFYGMEVPPSLIAGMLLSELLVHGVDLARTHSLPIDVPDDAAHHALLATCTLTPLALTPWGATRSMVLGYSPRGYAPIIVELDEGRVVVGHRTDRKVDAWFGGTAQDLLLASYNRLSAARALATVRLRGRRPYLALVVGKAFEPA
jgi:uncharacterized protein (TIGR03083 family)